MKRIERKCILFLINFLFSVQLLYSQSNISNQSGVTKIKDGIYLLTDYGCNIIISQGSDGLLIIDTGLKDLELKLDSAIAVFSDLPVQYVLNTHFHFDHAGGNHVFGAKGAIIVAHENSRKHMESAWKVPKIVEIQFPTIPPYPKTALPKISFNNSLKIHFNNDTIYALHYPKGHSDSDAFYFFCNANLIHTGDLFLSNGFTFIDVFTGG
ncbi:MAG: MBL fold metallo-hydrolase, partial [Anaerolineaceae bacterium]|nr:MBL fold metallo-hydrolase [Anaerolineaceae bacterium]